jgi:hypothetical protein
MWKAVRYTVRTLVSPGLLLCLICFGAASCSNTDPLTPTEEEIEERRQQIEHGRQVRQYEDIKRQKRKDAEYQRSVEGEAPPGLRE